jgi:hypothetical protein
MADKLQQGIQVLVEFVGGEAPTAEKLSAITAQLRHAARQLEVAVGDIRGQSYPYSQLTSARLSPPYGKMNTSNVGVAAAETRDLDIANIGRLIGPASNLNPHLLEAGSITVSVPTGVHEFALPYPVDGTPSSVVTFTGDTTPVFDTFKDVDRLMNAGDYHVTSGGKVYCVTETVASITLTYTIDPASWGGGTSNQGARFNVIPDPNQLSAGGTGVTVGAVDANGRYPCVLPTITHQQWDEDGVTSVLAADDPNYGQQLYLPEVIVDNYTAGETIPEGFIYLKNWTTGEVYQDADYVYDTNKTLLVGNVDLTTELAAGDEFIILTIGNDLTSAVDDLRRKARHSHDRTWGEPYALLDGLVGIVALEGNTGPFVPSDIPGNFAPQYLHRDGWRSGYDYGNLNDQNAMRGSLVIGYTGQNAGNILDLGGAGTDDTSTTFELIFGNPGGSRYCSVFKENMDLVSSCTVGGTHEQRNGHLVNEEGIRTDDVGYSVAAITHTINPYKTWYIDTSLSPGFELGTMSASGLLSIPLDGSNWPQPSAPSPTHGIDFSSKTIWSFSILVQVFYAPAWWITPETTYTAAYTYSAYLDASTPKITLMFGASWSVTLTDCNIKLLIHYTD